MPTPVLEVCVQSPEDAVLAAAAGADRIELCEDLTCDGLTPRREWIEQVRSQLTIPVIVLIRCRDGGFVYNANDRAVMLEQASVALAAGADGIAIGACLAGGRLDGEFLRAVAQAVRAQRPQSQLVMHRAFDTLLDPDLAVRQLIDLGFDRILTSGGAASAVQGVERLRTLQGRHGDRIEVLPAGGICSDNAAMILEATGCWQLHGSMRAIGSDHPCPAQIQRVRQVLARCVPTPS
ncbi:MAG: copper homeostasis protein CutC [Pirellula sp.]